MVKSRNYFNQYFLIHLLGKFMATFSPLRSLIFLDRVLNLGCPGKIASSGKNNDFVAPLSGVGVVGGWVKSSQPNLINIYQKL